MNSDAHHLGFKSYLSGFLFFLFLTLLSYFVVLEHLLNFSLTIFVIVGCAIIQSTVQLGIFLDLITEPKPRSNLHIFSLMVLILLIVIAGTFWIMYSLDERVMMGGMS